MGCQSAFRRPVFGLRGGIGIGQRNDPADIGALQRTLGWHEQFATANAQDTNRPHQIPAAQAQAETVEATPALFDLIRRVQQAHGLKQDATLLPGGETQRTLNELLDPVLRRSAEAQPPTPNPHPPGPDQGAEPVEPDEDKPEGGDEEEKKVPCSERWRRVAFLENEFAKVEETKLFIANSSYNDLSPSDQERFLPLLKEHGELPDDPQDAVVSTMKSEVLKAWEDLRKKNLPQRIALALLQRMFPEYVLTLDEMDKTAGYPSEAIGAARKKAFAHFQAKSDEIRTILNRRRGEYAAHCGVEPGDVPDGHEPPDKAPPKPDGGTQPPDKIPPKPAPGKQPPIA